MAASRFPGIYPLSIESPINGQTIVYDAAAGLWVNGSGGSLPNTVTDPADGQLLIYASGEWVNYDDLIIDADLHANYVSLIWPDGYGMLLADASENNYLDLKDYFTVEVEQDVDFKPAQDFNVFAGDEVFMRAGAVGADDHSGWNVTTTGQWQWNAFIGAVEKNTMTWDLGTTTGTIAIAGSTTAFTFTQTLAALAFLGPVVFPTSDPMIAGAWWNNAGTLQISAA